MFLGSSFAFISPLAGACAYGFLGIFVGSLFAGLVYVLIALIVKKTGTAWVTKLLPPVVIGPTVALIGLSLCGSAVNNLNNTAAGSYNLVAILVGLIAFFITVFASVKGTQSMKMVPFIIGILGAYVIALILTFIGRASGCEALQLVKLSAFDNVQLFKVPRFTFLGMFGAYKDATNTIGSANGFMAMLMVGTMFEFNPDKSFLREAATILAVRYIAAALFASLFYFVLPFPLEIRQVLAIVAFAPGSAMSPAFTEKLKGNAALASFVGSVSILISVAVITCLLAAMGLN